MGQHQLSKIPKTPRMPDTGPENPIVARHPYPSPAGFCGLFHVMTKQAALALTSLGVLLDNRRRENRADPSCKTAHDAPKHVKEVLLLGCPAPLPIPNNRLDLGRDLRLGVGDLDG